MVGFLTAYERADASDGQHPRSLLALAGLLPIMFSHGAGADVMKRIAAPTVGGVVTSGILELIVYPAIYMLWRGKEFRSSRRLQDGIGS